MTGDGWGRTAREAAATNWTEYYRQEYKQAQRDKALLVGLLVGLVAGLLWEAIRR